MRPGTRQSKIPPGNLWTCTCANYCRLMHGSYAQGDGTNGSHLRVFFSTQAPWRVLPHIIKKAGGSSDHYSLVRKLIKHFEQTNLDVEKFMLDCDLRGTGSDNGDPLNGIIYCS